MRFLLDSEGKATQVATVPGDGASETTGCAVGVAKFDVVHNRPEDYSLEPIRLTTLRFPYAIKVMPRFFPLYNHSARIGSTA